jgi:hypothetical protein
MKGSLKLVQFAVSAPAAVASDAARIETGSVSLSCMVSSLLKLLIHSGWTLPASFTRIHFAIRMS